MVSHQLKSWQLRAVAGHFNTVRAASATRPPQLQALSLCPCTAFALPGIHQNENGRGHGRARYWLVNASLI